MKFFDTARCALYRYPFTIALMAVMVLLVLNQYRFLPPQHIERVMIERMERGEVFEIPIPFEEVAYRGERSPYRVSLQLNIPKQTIVSPVYELVSNGCITGIWIVQEGKISSLREMVPYHMYCKMSGGLVLDFSPYVKAGQQEIIFFVETSADRFTVNIRAHERLSILLFLRGVMVLVCAGSALIILRQLWRKKVLKISVQLLGCVAIFYLARITLEAVTNPVESLRGQLQHKAYGQGYTIRSGMEAKGYVELSEMPDALLLSVMRQEDFLFLEHAGVHWRSVWLAIGKNLSQQKIVTGASTIPMQLSKNIFLERWPAPVRKVLEVIYAYRLEDEFSKEEILELYLNSVQFGPHLFGIGNAARVYFNKVPAELTLEESVFLASLIASPNKCSRWFYTGTSEPDCVERFARMLDFTTFVERGFDSEKERGEKDRERKLRQTLERGMTRVYAGEKRNAAQFLSQQPMPLKSEQEVIRAREEGLWQVPLVNGVSHRLYFSSMVRPDHQNQERVIWRDDKSGILLEMKRSHFNKLSARYPVHSQTAKLKSIHKTRSGLSLEFSEKHTPFVWMGNQCQHCIHVYPVTMAKKNLPKVRGYQLKLEGRQLTIEPAVLGQKNIHPRRPIRFSGNAIELQWLAPREKNLRVVIDPGHGGVDFGAKKNGIYEKDLNLEFSFILRDMLEKRGIDVTLLRDVDIYQTLKQRYVAIEESHADIALSIHHDIAVYQKDRPVCIYKRRDLERLCQRMLERMQQQGLTDLKLWRKSLIVTQPMQTPSVLLEILNMGNKAELEILSNKQRRVEFYRKLAISISHEVARMSDKQNTSATER